LVGWEWDRGGNTSISLSRNINLEAFGGIHGAYPV
jgi:hypothetical protein